MANWSKEDEHTLFQEQAANYDVGRPAHDRQAIAAAVSLCGLLPGSVVLDVGGGTGAVSEILAMQHYLQAYVVEPQAEMRAAAIDRAKNIEGLHVLDGTSDNIPVSDNHADAIIMGNAGHWFLSTYEKTMSEFSRVLKPDASVMLLYTMLDQEHQFTKELDSFFSENSVGYDSYRSNFLKKPPEWMELVSKAYIGDHEPQKYTWPINFHDADSFITTLETYGLYPHQQEGFEDKVREFYAALADDYGLSTSWQTTVHVGTLLSNDNLMNLAELGLQR